MSRSFLSGYLKNFWVKNSKNHTGFVIGYKYDTLADHISNFSFFEDKLLAIEVNSVVFVYLIVPNGKTMNDACTLVRILYPFSNTEFIRIAVDEYLYMIDSNCTITCLGRH